MNDAIEWIIITLHTIVILYAMSKHHSLIFKCIGTLIDLLSWVVASFFLLSIVRIPIYLIVYGKQIPFHPTETMRCVTGLVSGIFWGLMIYFQIPMRIVRFFKKT